MSEETWYENLRDKWKPSKVGLLFIAESAPDNGGDPNNRRFFYSERLSQADNLFRSVVAALYDAGKLRKDDSKHPWLTRLQNDGVYLIDLAPRPVNSLSPATRRGVLLAGVDECVRAAEALRPSGIVVCHAPTYKLLAGPLRDAGLPLLHDEAIPFPLGNKRAEFVQKVRQAIAGSPGPGAVTLGETAAVEVPVRPRHSEVAPSSVSSVRGGQWTPIQLARELGYTDEQRPGKVVRDYLRKKYPTHRKYQPWVLDEVQAADVRKNIPRRF